MSSLLHTRDYLVAAALALSFVACGKPQAQANVPGLVISPTTASLATGATLQLTAQVTNSSDTVVAWSLDEPTAGSLSATGLYQAGGRAGTFHVRATADVDKSLTAVSTITVSVPAAAPVVTSFAPSSASIAAGTSTTLSWAVEAAETISIDQGIGVVTATSVAVSPNVTTTYTLTATNDIGSTTATTTVTVLQKPQIATFTASPTAISSGASTTLSWSVAGADTLAIDQGIGAVTGSSSHSVSPTATTTYTLTAINAVGSTTATAVVTVTTTAPPPSSAPVITSFTAPSPVANAGAVALAWAATNATSYSLDNGIGSVGAATSTTVHPTASTTYHLTATNSAGSALAAISVTVEPAAAQPLIESFTADALLVQSGGAGTTLRWTAINATTSLNIDNGVGSVSSATSAVVTPANTTTYTLTAVNPTGTVTSSITVAVNSAAYLTPSTTTTQAVTFTLDSSQKVHPISRFIYGYNAGSIGEGPSGATMLRLGGNRWTAYNWETNASNAGSDYYFENDTFLGGGATPGGAALPTLAAAQGAGIGALLTLAMQGWVSADEAGAQNLQNQPINAHFFQTLPRKAASFASPPSTSDKFVYQDEFVGSLLTQYPSAFGDPVKPLFIELDNEPDLWPSTHAEVQRVPLTYASLIRSAIDLTSAVKDQVPQATIFGPVSYGFEGYVSLQDASDADPAAKNLATPPDVTKWFLYAWLNQLRAAGEAQGRRLVDVLDLHWYSSAQGGGIGVTAANNTAAVQAARVQAPRSLWDTSYSCDVNNNLPVNCELSWIANYFGNWGKNQPGTAFDYGAIQLIPNLRSIIAGAFPGTKIAFTEYNHGGGDDISGAVAEADTLGIFGRDDVFAASYWPLLSDDRFTHAAYRAYRNYDGAGGAFGDTSILSSSTDDSKASAYASVDSSSPNRVVVVIVNKTTGTLGTQLNLKHTVKFTKAHLYQVTSGSAYTAATSSTAGYVSPTALSDVTLAASATNSLDLSLPAYSVTTVVLIP